MFDSTERVREHYEAGIPNLGALLQRLNSLISGAPNAEDRDLPADNPTSGVDWNIQRRRDTAMGVEDLPRWFREAGADAGGDVPPDV